MTRSSTHSLHALDPEIDRTYHRLVRTQTQASNHIGSSSASHHSNSEISEFFDSSSFSSLHHISDSEDMDNFNHRTLKELAAPDFNHQTLCINYPDEQVPFVLKTGLIHLLPRFHGLAGEDPHKHLKEFHIVCSTMRPQGVPEEHVQLKAFPFSLQDAAKDWLYYLPPGSIPNWETLKRLFLEKFFPASRAASIRKDICGIRQLDRETLYEYWERFKRLCASCPHHQISDQLLIQYFYEGLNPVDRSMIDAASGGALVDKTPIAARNLIENMATNSQQFASRNNSAITRGVHEVSYAADHQKLESKLDDLASMVKELAMIHKASPSAGVAPLSPCQFCSAINHTADSCPSLHDPPQAFAANLYRPPQQQQQQQN